ncbi:PQQ-binding-like beta-propeller repeat protein [Streptomyces sp. Li-HN-5-11]|uniref:serine/threonine-protein kinase n=1 Tax=Streptomyces sp. Li-HN-5-11 TaxID=3075432 RepID=UPI0028B1E698|nr:PQQ-binding-like beta-propeller repeat protein [Streptomyces sp. Li-HN-5-11]WNM36205.1 PQQ-binding-like beta-propeller repeat protein [Streptomyces sp. Li-HN-5-11]
MVEGFGELRVGDPVRLGPYTLLGRIGAGGMGQVYLGHSPSGRRVAVKTVRLDSVADASFRRRFDREVTAARSVSGFYTAPVVDADSRAPVPWFATAYVAAPDLADLVGACGPFSAPTLPRLAAHLAEALVAIHRVGLVHRDIKPGNILVTVDGPLVLDFGIARWPDTETYLLGLGTPAYSSPEQFTATPASLGTPSDLYSLVSTLVFAATGQPPYSGAGALAVIDAVRSGPPDLTALPPGLRRLLAPCVALDPAARPTAEQLLSDLAGLVGHAGESFLSEQQFRYVAEFSARRRPAPNSGRTRLLAHSWTAETEETSWPFTDMTPMIDGDHVLVPTNRHVVRLHAATGQRIARIPKGEAGPPMPGPQTGRVLALAGQVVVRRDGDDVLSAIDIDGTTTLWTKQHTAFSPRFMYISHDADRGDLIVVNGSTVLRLELLTGETHWEAALEGWRFATWSPPLLTPTAVVVHDEYDVLYALDRDDGRLLWSQGKAPIRGIFDDPFAGTPPALVKTDETRCPETVWVPLEGWLRRFALADGQELPMRAGPFRRDWYNGPHVAAAGSRVYVTADDLHVLDAATTELIRTVPVPSPIGAPLVSDGRIYVNSRGGKLYAISAETLDIAPER